MANRSNRRRQNPCESRCEKHDKPIGSWRANSPSWPRIGRADTKIRGRIHVSSRTHPARERNACKRGGVHTRTFIRGWRRGLPRPSAGRSSLPLAEPDPPQGLSQADSFGDICGILDRLEHPVDDTGVVVDLPVEGGAEAVDEAHRCEARWRAGTAAPV